MSIQTKIKRRFEMAEQTIICPKCGNRIPVSKVLTAQIESDLRESFESEAQKRDKQTQAAYEKRLSAEKMQLEKKIRVEAEQTASAELTALKKQLTDSQKREKVMQSSFDKRIVAEKTRLEKEAKKIAEEELSEQMDELQMRLREKDKQVAEAQRQKTEVQKLENRLAAREKALESEIARKVERASRQAEVETAERIESEHQTHVLELEKKLSDWTLASVSII
jgi:hypothetical protein